MKRSLSTGMVLVLLGALSGCPTERVCIRIDSAKATDLRFSFCGKAPTVAEVFVRAAGEDIEHWVLLPISETRGRIREVRYGVAPPGWSAGGKPRMLRPGDKLTVGIRGPNQRGELRVTIE